MESLIVFENSITALFKRDYQMAENVAANLQVTKRLISMMKLKLAMKK